VGQTGTVEAKHANRTQTLRGFLVKQMTLDISGAVIGTSTMLAGLRANMQVLVNTGMIDQQAATKAIADLDAIRADVFAAIIPNAVGHDWLLGLCGFNGDGTVFHSPQKITPPKAPGVERFN
jgi:hypothetical protein